MGNVILLVDYNIKMYWKYGIFIEIVGLGDSEFVPVRIIVGYLADLADIR